MCFGGSNKSSAPAPAPPPAPPAPTAPNIIAPNEAANFNNAGLEDPTNPGQPLPGQMTSSTTGLNIPM